MKEQSFLPYEKLQQLLDDLRRAGFECVGPKVKDGAIVYSLMESIKDLPWGVRDYQAPGEYRLTVHDKAQAFAWANGPMAAKPRVFKSQETVFRVKRDENNHLQFESAPKASAQALIGIRPCDVHALTIQDKVFLDSEVVDPFYKAHREKLFIVVVNCSYSSNNCFCLSAGGHPKASVGYDMALTEITGGFVLECLSDTAISYRQGLDLSPATPRQLKHADEKIQQAVEGQTKQLPKGDIAKSLIDNPNHPQWDDVASRCLSCGNCTQVCPTCFCHRQEAKPALDTEESEQVRHWDSCFSKGHSYIHGMTVREGTKQRYRQWLTHKLSTWHQQFGTSGCVGCGRCITWCPTGIDLTSEVKKIMGDDGCP